MKIKSTKSALLMSFTSLLLCFAMLIGCTFAWFTDSVTSGVNKIQAGNLDVELYHSNKTKTDEQIKNGDQNLLFKDVAFWEPGAYAYETFKVKNVGNLALKYKMNLNVVGKNDLNGHDLTEVLKVATTDTAPATRADAAALSYTTLDSWVLNNTETLYPNGTQDKIPEKTFTVVLYWEPTENDDLYNANNNKATSDSTALYIDLGVNLFATQVEHETDSFGTDYDKAAALPVNSVAKGNLKVTDESSANNAIVNTEQTITDEDNVMSVKYPDGVKLANNGAVTGEDGGKKTPVQQKLEYKGATPSSASVTIGADKAVAYYELTLPVAEENTTPVTVTINYTPGLSGVQIYHSGTPLTATDNDDGESATYDAASGVLTLRLKHASPIDIVYNRVSNLPANAKLVMNLEELETAVGNLRDGDYIAFGANIVQDKVDTSSGQITFARANNAEGDIKATLDLNGYVFDGQIGGFSFDNDGITVNVIGTEKAVAQYYEHETDHHMVKAHAVFNYSGKTILKSGLFESNNGVVAAYGGEVVVENGTIHNTASGVCLYACNDPKITINNGSFSCETKGAIMQFEPYREDEGPDITINGGTFDWSKGACFMAVSSENVKNMGKLVINGGTFIGTGENDWVQGFKDGNASNRIEIKGGTFNNANPSDYVAEGYKAVQNGSTWTVVKD